MKKIFLMLLLIFQGHVFSQVKVNTDEILFPEDATNIFVHKIAGDSLSTTFLILIKESVPMHKHEEHSETVIVLEGTASMLLGNENMDIKKGDVLFIPAGTWHKVEVTSETPLRVISVQAPYFDGSDRVLYRKN